MSSTETTKPTPLELPPLPTFSDFTGLIDFQDTKKKFSKIKWRIWQLMKSEKHMTEQFDSYTCESKAYHQCKMEYNNRKTLKSHRRNLEHRNAHEKKYIGWKESTEFIYVTQEVKYSDGKTRTMCCLIGEKKIENPKIIYPSKKQKPKKPFAGNIRSFFIQKKINTNNNQNNNNNNNNNNPNNNTNNNSNNNMNVDQENNSSNNNMNVDQENNNSNNNMNVGQENNSSNNNMNVDQENNSQSDNDNEQCEEKDIIETYRSDDDMETPQGKSINNHNVAANNCNDLLLVMQRMDSIEKTYTNEIKSLKNELKKVKSEVNKNNNINDKPLQKYSITSYLTNNTNNTLSSNKMKKKQEKEHKLTCKILQKHKALIVKFDQKQIREFDMKSLLRLTPKLILKCKQMRFKLKIKYENNNIYVYCKICSRYIQCSALSTTIACCKRHGFQFTNENLSSVAMGSKLIEYFVNHFSSTQHKKVAPSFYEYDTANRILTYLQVIDILEIIRKNIPSSYITSCGASKAITGHEGNINQSIHRVEVVREEICTVYKNNWKRFMQVPTCNITVKNIKFSALVADSCSAEGDKGEMAAGVNRHNSKWVAGVIGWIQWKYTSSKTVITDKDKAVLVYEMMDNFDFLPTALTDTNIENDELVKHLIVQTFGDSKYLKTLIEYLNVLLMQKHIYCRIWVSLAGEVSKIDDNHRGENAWTATLKLFISIDKFDKELAALVAYGRDTKMKTMKQQEHIGKTLKFYSAPDERQLTHKYDSLQPIMDDFDLVLQLIDECKWKKIDGILVYDTLMYGLSVVDWLECCIMRQYKTNQRSQNYRGSIGIVDAAALDNHNLLMENKQMLLYCVDYFLNNKNLLIFKEFTSQMHLMSRIKEHFYDMIITGKYKGVELNYKEQLRDVKKRKYGKRAKQQSQIESLNNNLKQCLVFFESVGVQDRISMDIESDSREISMSSELYEEAIEDIVESNNILNDTIHLAQIIDTHNTEEKSEDTNGYSATLIMKSIDAPQQILAPTQEQTERALLLCESLIYCLDCFDRFKYELFVVRKPVDLDEEEINWMWMYFPQLIDDICNLDYDSAKKKSELILKGLYHILSIYKKYKIANQSLKTEFLFRASVLEMRKCIIIFKSFFIEYLWKDNYGKKLKSSFGELYLEDQYNEYKIILTNLENISKTHLGSVIPAFYIFWEMHQIKVKSSSTWIEPACSGVRYFKKGNVGRPKEHKSVSENIIIKSHCTFSKRDKVLLGTGVGNKLCDKGSGVLKLTNKHNVKRRKPKNEKSTAIEKENKGIETKFTSELLLNENDIRNS